MREIYIIQNSLHTFSEVHTESGILRSMTSNHNSPTKLLEIDFLFWGKFLKRISRRSWRQISLRSLEKAFHKKDKFQKVLIVGQSNGCMDGRMDEWTDVWTDERTQGWAQGRKDARTGRRTGGRTDGPDGQTEGRSS